MNLLLYDMGSYIYNDLLYYLRSAGHNCKTIYYHFPNRYDDTFFSERFEKYLKEDNYDFVISVNFFPLIATICNEHQIKYISWCYDSPLDIKLQDYFHYDTNYIFLFDQIEVQQYHALGFSNVYHLPLAVNTNRLDALHYTSQQIAAFSSEISMVGHLYNSDLETILYTANDYIKGYIEGILQAQLRTYGYYMIDDLLTEDLLDSINQSFQNIGQAQITLNRRGLSYAIAKEITHLERSFLLEQCGELFDTHLYTSEPCSLSKVKICGPVKYLDEMPCVFRYSKLNLNPTLKCIQSGIPLRALDIMGSHGVLLSNYQPELDEYFENESDLILYSSIEDAIEKANFYLKHENLRDKIAMNGYEKIKKHFNYPNQIEKILQIVQSS